MDLEPFNSGVAVLDTWLTRRARRNEKDGASRTFVVCQNRRVVAYYSLSAAAVSHAVATGRIRRNMPDPIPAAVLGRLAVDVGWRGRGLGSGILADAVSRILGAGEAIGIRAILVHALLPEARAFYEKHGFRPSPIDPMTLTITVAEAWRSLGRDP
jgi:GNAT superfamily N-acetyltransferase